MSAQRLGLWRKASARLTWAFQSLSIALHGERKKCSTQTSLAVAHCPLMFWRDHSSWALRATHLRPVPQPEPKAWLGLNGLMHCSALAHSRPVPIDPVRTKRKDAGHVLGKKRLGGIVLVRGAALRGRERTPPRAARMKLDQILWADPLGRPSGQIRAKAALAGSMCWRPVSTSSMVSAVQPLWASYSRCERHESMRRGILHWGSRERY